MNPLYLYMPRPFIIRFHKQQYRFSMYLFSTMVNARSLADLVSRVRLIKLLLCSKVQSQSMRHAHDALVDIINGLDDIEDDNMKNDEIICSNKFDNDEIAECKQPFGTFFQIQLEKVQVDNTGVRDNTYYKPELFASILQNWLPTAPFWTALLLGMCMINIIL